MTSKTKASQEDVHRRHIYQCNFALKCIFFGILCASTLLPQFDASALLVSTTWPATALLRWDAFHFLHTAEHGYLYEHEFAFLPGVAYLMRGLRFLYTVFGGNIPRNSQILWPTLLGALLCDNSQIIYSLSLYHLRSPDLALLATLLSLIPTSPVILYFAPYNEPYFTHFSLLGMLCCTRSEWLKASVWFALAGIFRSNGILLCGYILWGLLVQPLLSRTLPTIRAILKSVLLTTVVVAPFVTFQTYAYFLFCSGVRTHTPEWCSRFPPSIYTHVQSKYWDVGFLRYWTLNQLPNFALAAPTLALIFAFASYHLQRTTALEFLRKKDRLPILYSFENASITPHAIHATILASILLFASHTQIVLRLAASLPFVHWAAAWLLTQHPSIGRLWVKWSVLWGAASIFLWSTFLPPA